MGIWNSELRGVWGPWLLAGISLYLTNAPLEAQARQGDSKQPVTRQQAAPKPLAPEQLDVIVAVVNDDVIVRSELDGQLQLTLAQSRGRDTPLPERATLERQVLDRMIDNRLQIQRAKQLGIEADDTRVMQAITGIAERNNMTLEQLRAVLAAEGIGFNQFREDTRVQLITGQLQAQEVVNRIGVTDQEIDRQIKHEPPPKPQPRLGVHLLHLLVVVPEGASTEEVQKAKGLASQIQAKLRGGADFAQAGASASGAGLKVEAGDLGWLEMGQVPTLVADASQRLGRGEVTDPIRSPSGFHLFKLVDYRGGELPRPVIMQTKARHILIKTTEVVSDEDARLRLEQLRLRLVGGEGFAGLARAHSEDTGSAIRGGDLGWVSTGDTVPQFERAMNELKPGEISQPFKTPFGWHIVQVEERRDQDSTAQVARKRAEASVKERKAQEAIELWLRRLRAEAYLEVRLPDHPKQ